MSVEAQIVVTDGDATRQLDVADFGREAIVTALGALTDAISAGTVEQTDLTYDDDGNLTSYVEGGLTWTLTYDGDGNLLSVTHG